MYDFPVSILRYVVHSVVIHVMLFSYKHKIQIQI